MEQAGVQLVAKDADSYISNLRNAEKATLGFVDATDSGSGRVSAAGQVMIGALRQVGVIAVEAFGQALRAGAAFIGDSIDLAGDFEQTMSVLGAVSGATGDELAAVSAKAKALGADLTLPATSAVDAGEAMLELAKAGFTTQQAMDAAKGTLQLAAAAQIEEAKAAEISSNAINAFNLEAKDALFVSDLLAASANASSVEITDVAQSYQMAGAIFANFQGPVVGAKESLVDLTTAIGILGNAGIKGSDAGTSLKQSLLQLTGPSQAAKDQMKALMFAAMGAGKGMGGLDEALTGNATERGEALNAMRAANPDIARMGDIAYDGAGKMRPFNEIIRLTAQATAGMTDEMRNQAITSIFGADAARAILVLMKEGPAVWDAMSQAVTREGAAADLAAAQTAGYKGAIEGAKSQIETLQLTIGQYLTPILADLINTYISPGIATFTTFTEALFGNNEAFAQLSPTMQEIVSTISTLVADVQNIAGAFQDAGAGSVEFAMTLGELASDLGLPGDLITDLVFLLQDKLPPAIQTASDLWMNTLQPALAEVGRVLAEDVMPILRDLAETVFPLLQSALETGASFWENVLQPAIETVWKYLNEYTIPVLKEVATWLKDNVPPAVETLADFLQNTLFPAFKEVWSFLDTNVIPIMKTLADAGLKVVGAAAESLADVWKNVLSPAFKAVGSFIKDVLAPIFKALVDVNLAILQKASDALAGLWQKVLQPALKAVGDYISDKLSPVFKSIGDWLSATFGPTLEKVKAWLDKVTAGFGGVSGAVETVVGWLKDLATNISNLKLPDWLTPGSPTPLEIGLRGIGDALQKSVGPGVAAFNQGLTSISEAIAGGTLIDEMKQLGLDAMAGLGAGIQRGVRSVVRIVDSVSNTVTGAFNDAFGAHSPATKVMPTGENVMLGLMAGVESMIPALTTLIDQIASSMIDALRRNREEMSKQISEAADALIEQARDLAMDINAAIADGFSSTASIDRQIAKNLGSMKDVLPDYRQFVEGALQEAENQARRMADPVQGAKFFKQRSDQILEYEKLRQQLGEETDSGERQRIKDQMTLINRAQIAEGRAFEAEMAGQQSPIQQIVDQFQQILNNPNIALPGIFDNTIIARLTSLINQLQTPAQNLYANPPASAQQMAYGGNNTSYSSTRTYSMPIYTNQSPAALQQSLAIAQAVMP